VAVIEKHYEDHPLDNSREGIIAQYSGMSKEQVIAVIDLVEYLDFLAKYDPTSLLPVPAEHVDIPLVDQVPNIIIADHYANPAPYLIVYADTRTRSHAA
jgi:hypothetical protein